MVRSAWTITHPDDCGVSELWPRTLPDALPAQQLHPRIERDLSEGHDDLRARNLVDLGLEMIETTADLLWHRLVVRWRAAHRHHDVRVFQSETIVDLA